MWCCVKEFIHNKIFDTYYKIGDVSLELTSSVWKGPFSQIFVKFGNFHFKTMLAKVVIQVVRCIFFNSVSLIANETDIFFNKVPWWWSGRMTAFLLQN